MLSENDMYAENYLYFYDFISTGDNDPYADGGEAGRVDRLKTGVPLQRGGLPLEVAEAILWLLSDASAYTSASFIDVSGGR